MSQDNTLDERRLIRKAKAGDQQAFGALLSKHEMRMYNIAYRMMGNSEDAMDMVQEAMIKVYRSLGRFEGSAQLGTWLYRVTTNTCLDELRRRKLRQTVSLDERMEKGAPSPPDHIFAKPEEAVEQMEKNQALRAAIKKLTPEHQAAIVLRDMQGMTYQQAAKIMDCPIGTMKSRVNRARAALREELKNQTELFPIAFRQKQRKEVAE